MSGTSTNGGDGGTPNLSDLDLASLDPAVRDSIMKVYEEAEIQERKSQAAKKSVKEALANAKVSVLPSTASASSPSANSGGPVTSDKNETSAHAAAGGSQASATSAREPADGPRAIEGGNTAGQHREVTVDKLGGKSAGATLPKLPCGGGTSVKSVAKLAFDTVKSLLSNAKLDVKKPELLLVL